MKFSNWIKWLDRNKLNDLQCPGVYIISYNEHDINNNSFDWIKEIRIRHGDVSFDILG